MDEIIREISLMGKLEFFFSDPAIKGKRINYISGQIY